MDTAQLKYILEDLNFSAAMPTEVLSQLAAACRIQNASAGTTLFREGSENHDLFVVRSGRIALEMNVPGRGSVRILTMGPGEMVGWSALLGAGKMTASAVAVEPAQLVVAAADQLTTLCGLNHEFGYYFMQRMADALAKRLVATRLQLLDLFADAPPAISTEVHPS